MIQRRIFHASKQLMSSSVRYESNSLRFFSAAPASKAEKPSAKAPSPSTKGSASPTAAKAKATPKVSVRSWARDGLRKQGEEMISPDLADEFFVIDDETLLTPSDKVTKLADEIFSLTPEDRDKMFGLLEARIGFAARDVVKQTIENGGVFPGLDAAATTGAAEEAPKEEKTAFNLKLGAVDAKVKIKVIKEVRTITGLGLKEAKELVEKAPVVLKEGLKKEEAEAFIKLLADAGAEAKME